MIITPYNHRRIMSLKNAVFLAGTCPIQEHQEDWREEAISILNEIGFNGDIINPVNPQYDGDLSFQTAWQHKCMSYASYILFWIPRDKKHLALTTNIELGEWLKSSRIAVGFPSYSENNNYIRERLKSIQKPVSDTLKATCMEVLNMSKRRARTFFTSDTHFSAERTFKLSYRPYMNVQDMDLNLISNWNKLITMNDDVIHLGDFGNPDTISLLNFKTMYFLSGNYERNDKSIVERLKKDDRVVILDGVNNKVKINGKEYYLCHEPLNNMGKDKFYLYGHIHRLQSVKRNGINVGIDANRFRPVSTSEIEFLRGGIDKYFDENVFTEYCF